VQLLEASSYTQEMNQPFCEGLGVIGVKG